MSPAPAAKLSPAPCAQPMREVFFALLEATGAPFGRLLGFCRRHGDDARRVVEAAAGWAAPADMAAAVGGKPAQFARTRELLPRLRLLVRHDEWVRAERLDRRALVKLPADRWALAGRNPFFFLDAGAGFAACEALARRLGGETPLDPAVRRWGLAREALRRRPAGVPRAQLEALFEARGLEFREDFTGAFDPTFGAAATHPLAAAGHRAFLQLRAEDPSARWGDWHEYRQFTTRLAFAGDTLRAVRAGEEQATTAAAAVERLARLVWAGADPAQRAALIAAARSAADDPAAAPPPPKRPRPATISADELMELL